jgi:hypothetical protein
VGYRISAGAVTVFCVPDVAWIIDRHEALSGAKVYVGDGATIRRSMVRKPGDAIIGHVPIRTQLTWCQNEGVPRAILTHCGSQTVEGDERVLGAEIRHMAEDRGVEAEVAYDGMAVVLRWACSDGFVNTCRHAVPFPCSLTDSASSATIGRVRVDSAPE